MKITSRYSGHSVHILIDGILHLSFDWMNLVGVQAYIDGDSFKIELHVKGKNKPIKCEYSTFAKWRRILKELEQYA